MRGVKTISSYSGSQSNPHHILSDTIPLQETAVNLRSAQTPMHWTPPNENGTGRVDTGPPMALP